MIVRKQIICFDQDGKQLGPPEDIPETESIPHGLSALSGYVARLLNSGASFSSLTIFTFDKTRGCGLTRRESELLINFALDRHRNQEQEHCLRTFFAGQDIVPVRDYLAQNGGTPDATRVLMYPLPNSCESITALCNGLFVSCFGISNEDTLQFRSQGTAGLADA